MMRSIVWLAGSGAGVSALLATAAIVRAGDGSRPAMELAGLHARAAAARLFRTSEACIACHNNMRAAGGEDISFGAAWRGSMMANSARDPYWQASVRRETLLHPEHAASIEDECATCHMPMARYEARAAGRRGQVFGHLPVRARSDEMSLLAADGVSCTVCHQITTEGLGTDSSFGGAFRVNESVPLGRRPVFGRFDVDSGRVRVMHSASEFVPTKGGHLSGSDVCATCHTLFTTALDDEGRVVGRLPEQVPYLEWRASAYATTATCQSCHMPALPDETPISGVVGVPRPAVARHDFRGGNFFMQEMLDRYRDQLGVSATPAELAAARARTLDHLGTRTGTLAIRAARLAGGRLVAEVEVANLAGHKFPTAYPSRRAWLHVVLRDAGGTVLFESGAQRADGAIEGNDNDADAAAFEPHHQVIESGDQVQVYESVMGDSRGRVTTSLISGARYLKDNRLLPSGFGRQGASPFVAPVGVPAGDTDFDGGSDRVRYAVAVSTAAASGPLTLEVELLFQPIGFRWARNLTPSGGAASREGDAFVAMYDAMASRSSARVARATAVVDEER